MIAPQEDGADCEIRNVERAGTLGLSTLIHGATADLDWVFGPLVLGRECTSIGPLLHACTERLWRGGVLKDELASGLVRDLRSHLPNVVSSILTQAGAVTGAKPSTRFEMVRRATLAQSYLHSVTSRPVQLNELSRAVGASPYRLLTGFQQCFGETPASYHRKLRLRLVLDEAGRRGVPIEAVCDEFGFAGASSFSHAYRRAFGRSPVWTKAAR